MSRIKKYRQAGGLSQSALGKNLGVRQGTIHNWEHGRGEPSISQAAQLASIFKCSITDLIESQDHADVAVHQIGEHSPI